jgi:hypothetical protein
MSSICYVHLSDVEYSDVDPDISYIPTPGFMESRWFTRGWTLQELIAPSEVIFFSKDWRRMGDKRTLGKAVSYITHITRQVLLSGDIFGSSVALRMSWAAKRETTRLEDMAYCLLGIFDVHMPLLYGEGDRAFQRLQEEIIKVSTDQSIFAWRSQHSTYATWRSLLARSPSEFAYGDIVPIRMDSENDPVTMNTGISLSLELAVNNAPQIGWQSGTEFIALLNCCLASGNSGQKLGIYLKKIGADDYIRVDSDRFHRQTGNLEIMRWAKISVKRRLDYNPWFGSDKCFRIRGFIIKDEIALEFQTHLPVSIEAKTSHLSNRQGHIFYFSEESMRRGFRQEAHCFVKLEGLGFDPISVTFFYDPQNLYHKNSCECTLDDNSDKKFLKWDSVVRVVNDEAFIVVNFRVGKNLY